ncbi:MAG TPA: hydrogenase maturation nickel metallochaperone HypA [Dehalococcoidia bacterium]|nr:hydrogenase maturation nickel metallochaperone HypA [Dehalococcoidia bacterium]
MHELSITQDILNIALQEAKNAHACKINKISIVVGQASGIVPDSVQFCFDEMKKGSIANEASLDFTIVPTQVKCRRCQHVSSPKDIIWMCDKCGSGEVDIIAGRELYLNSIEAEQEEAYENRSS